MSLVRSAIGYAFRIRGEIIWVAIGQIAYFGGTALGIKLLTNFLGPHGYGEFALGLSFAGLLNLFAYGPLSQAVLRFFSICRERGELPEYLALARHAQIGIALIIALLFVFAGGVTYVMFGKTWAAILMVSYVFGLATGINSTLLSLQTALRERRSVALYQAGDALLKPLLAIPFIYLLGGNGLSALIGYSVATALISVLLLRMALRHVTLTDAITKIANQNTLRTLKHELWSYSSPFIVFGGFATVSMYGDRWFLQQFFGSETVGIYVAISQIASAPVVLLVTIVTQVVAPIMFERAGTLSSDDQKLRSSRLQRMTVGFTALALTGYCMLTYLVSEPLVRLFTTPTFATHHHLMWILTLGVCFFQIGQVLVLKGFYQNQPSVYILPKAIQAVSFLVCITIVYRNPGVDGIAVSVLLSSILYAASVAIVNRVNRGRLN